MNMKISKRDISILLIVLGLIGAFCVYQFYFRGMMEKKKTYTDETAQLQKRLNSFYGIKDDEIIPEMKKNADELREMAKAFPAMYCYEDIIMYLRSWELLPYEEMYSFPVYTIKESEYPTTISGILEWDEGNGTSISGTYMFGSAEVRANYQVNGYKAFKDLINRIYLDEAPKTISQISAKMKRDTGLIEGAIAVDFYNVLTDSSVYEPVVITGVPTSLPDGIFGPTYTPTPTPTPTVSPNQERLQNQRMDQDEE